MLDAAPSLYSTVAHMHVFAQVGRQPYDILSVLRQLKAIGQLKPTVIIHTGTNGILTQDELRSVLTFLRDRERVLIVTVDVPRPWQDGSNQSIHAVAPRFRNVRIADWDAVSSGHWRYFVSDGVHLTTAGIIAYTHLIDRTLRHWPPAPSKTPLQLVSGVTAATRSSTSK